MAALLASLTDIHLTFGQEPLLVGAEMKVRKGARIALVGRNGSGKSTLLKILAGMVEPDEGTRFVDPSVTVRYLDQEPDPSGFTSIGEYAASQLAPGDEDWKVDALLWELNVDPASDPTVLSGGEVRRAALVRAIASEPDLLLLDEPTNHLDLPVIEWLENHLASRKSALVTISHDRAFAARLSTSCIWVDRGLTREFHQGFAFFEDWRDNVLAEEELDQHKLARKIVREEHWLRYGVTARRKRNQRRLCDLHALRAQKRDYQGPQGQVKLEASDAGKSGKQVVLAEHLNKSWGDIHPVRDFSIRILAKDRIGVVGPNGAGKSTLLGLLTGTLAPDSGQIKLGTNLQIASLDQKRVALKPEWTLAEALVNSGSDRVEINGKVKHVHAYMKDFLFSPHQARTKIEVLSGGEKARIMLARAFALPSNFLILDEPTNDLDLETLDLLQAMLAEYPGTVLLVSHDRDFLDRVVTSTIAFAGDGHWQVHPGGYSDIPKAQKTASAPAVSKPAKKSEKPKPKNSERMTFKDKHALQTLPQTIQALEVKISALQTELTDPDLYTRDPARFAKAGQELEAKTKKREQAEEQWLELEMQREMLE
jgi:ATP-binding cassette subfamily F protein uup